MVDSMQREPENLRAIVDMGSNGIRFSITSLQPPTGRIMPTLYQHRAGISLYDAQYSASGERQPIGDETIGQVVKAFKQFKRTCEDFQVADENVTVLATEATRTAMNSEDFRRQIKDAVGWDVNMLTKEEEGRIGAFGIASSLPHVDGLVMDLGGGSTQISWLSEYGDVKMPPSGAVSMPYGAAAMTRRLAEAEANDTLKELKQEVMERVKDAYQSLNVLDELKARADELGGFTLYLSGGGFRGWGYLLMSRHKIQPYPIPIVNGFRASREEFMGTEDIKMAAEASLQNEQDEVFRVSDRRASQVPAVAFLINALAEALPQIREVRFCQGGVREGYLFSSFGASLQDAHPLVVATLPFSSTSSKSILYRIASAEPINSSREVRTQYQELFKNYFLWAFARLLYYHSTHSKDLQASAALRSTTTGILASAHGIFHEQRARLGLALCAGFGGEVPPADQEFKTNLEQLVVSQDSAWMVWWIKYIGAVAALVAAVFPAGVCNSQTEGRLKIKSTWQDDGKGGLILRVSVRFSEEVDAEMFAGEVKDIEKVGKKKNWVGGKEGFGYKVVVVFEEFEHEY